MNYFWMRSFFSFVVCFVATVLSSDDRFREFLGETRKVDFALGLPAFETFPNTNGILQCTFLCLRLSLCMYFNYQISSDRGVCEVFKGLRHQNGTQLDDLLVAKPGFAFVNIISKGPYSCFDYLNMRQASWELKNGLYQIRDQITHIPYMVFCDFTSEPGSVWTLIQSISFSNASSFNKRYSINSPTNENRPNFESYRMTREQMDATKSLSTHWRITCNFQSRPSLYRDYVRARLDEVDIVTYINSNGTCQRVEFISIRGYNYTNAMIPFWQKGNIFHTDLAVSEWAGCGNTAVPTNLANEHSFGCYITTNSEHGCVSSPDSTTNTWLGRYF